MVVVLRVDGDNDLYAIAALDRSTVRQGRLLIHHTLQQRRVWHELEVVAADEDLVAGGLHRFLERDETCLGREVDRRAGAVRAAAGDLVRALTDERTIHAQASPPPPDPSPPYC